MFLRIFPKIRVDFIIEGWHNRCQHSWYFQESKTVTSFFLNKWCEYWDFERRSFYKVIKATSWKMFLSCPLIIVTYFWYFVKLDALIIFKCNFLRAQRHVCKTFETTFFFSWYNTDFAKFIFNKSKNVFGVNFSNSFVFSCLFLQEVSKSGRLSLPGTSIRDV